MCSWLTTKSQMDSYLRSLSKGDTFAVQTKRRDTPMYATVERVEDSEVRLFEISGYGYLKIQTAPSPSSNTEYTTGWYVLEDSNSGELYCGRIGPPSEVIERIHPEALSADYSGDVTLVAECNECGNKSPIRVSETDGPYIKKSLLKRDGKTVTPCCLSENWTSKIDN